MSTPDRLLDDVAADQAGRTGHEDGLGTRIHRGFPRMRRPFGNRERPFPNVPYSPLKSRKGDVRGPDGVFVRTAEFRSLRGGVSRTSGCRLELWAGSWAP